MIVEYQTQKYVVSLARYTLIAENVIYSTLSRMYKHCRSTVEPFFLASFGIC